MPDRRLARWLLGCAVCLALGCQACHRYRPVSVLVQDAETKKPLQGAEVRITYPMTRPSVAPWDSVERAGEDGIAHLRAAPYGEAGLRLAASADGYLPETINVPVQAIEEIPPFPLLLPDGPRPVTYTLGLYAGPSPSVELVLPKDFRGLVKAEVRVREDAPCPPGQRRFTYPVDPSGYVLVSGPAMLRRVLTPDFHARFPEGPELNRHPDFFEVGFRPIKAETDVQYFVVGDQRVFDMVRRDVEKLSAEEDLPTKGNPETGRRRRHHNGQAGPVEAGAFNTQAR